MTCTYHKGMRSSKHTRPVQEAEQIQQRNKHHQLPVKLAHDGLLFLGCIQLPPPAPWPQRPFARRPPFLLVSLPLHPTPKPIFSILTLIIFLLLFPIILFIFILVLRPRIRSQPLARPWPRPPCYYHPRRRGRGRGSRPPNTAITATVILPSRCPLHQSRRTRRRHYVHR